MNKAYAVAWKLRGDKDWALRPERFEKDEAQAKANFIVQRGYDAIVVDADSSEEPSWLDYNSETPSTLEDCRRFVRSHLPGVWIETLGEVYAIMRDDKQISMTLTLHEVAVFLVGMVHGADTASSAIICLRDVVDLMYPPGCLDEEWGSDTLGNISWALSNYGFLGHFSAELAPKDEKERT